MIYMCVCVSALLVCLHMCVGAVKGLLWGSYEGQREIGYSYHIDQTQGQLVYRNSLSLVAPCHPCFIRVSFQRHEHLNTFLFQDSALFSLFVSGLHIVNSVCLCLWQTAYAFLYTNVLFCCLSTSFNHWLLMWLLKLAVHTEAAWMLAVWMSN